MKAVWTLVGMLVVLFCRSALGLAPMTADRDLARSANDLALICDLWRSSTVGFEAKRQLLRAAASRDDLAKLAQDKLKEQGDNICLEFYIEIFSARPHHEAAPVLKETATNVTLGRGLRMAAVQALETLAGADYSPPSVLDANGRPDIELRAKAIVDWLGNVGQPAGTDAGRATDQIGRCTDKMSEQLRLSRSLDGHAFEPDESTHFRWTLRIYQRRLASNCSGLT